MSERLQKVLSSRGVASRRQAEELIAAGRVTVNGVPAIVGRQVDAGDAIEVDGVPLEAERPGRLYVALHKPTGVVSTTRDAHAPVTVIDLVPVSQRVYPAGRLDKETSGLLLLTNDGAWANLVTHPRHNIEKEYDVLVRGVPSQETIHRLAAGITLPDGTLTGPARVERRGGRLQGNGRLSVTVVEGKKRQIRLMAEAVGHPVIGLRRTRIGGIELGGLAPGEWRLLEPREVECVREIARRAASIGAPVEAAGRHRRSGIRR
jgi:23S rRNA pseudouridine2605 synthase